MTKVFLDTEFVDDIDGLELISLALVAETGPEYYAVFAETDIPRVISHAWLSANVVPHLPIIKGPRGWGWDAHLRAGSVPSLWGIVTSCRCPGLDVARS